MKKTKNIGLSFLIALGGVAIGWFLAFCYAPVDAMQGEVYRIIYLHVPSAATAFSLSAILGGISVYSFFSKRESTLLYARAAAEIGLLFTLLTLASGMLWGKPVWGTWWTWDARLTTTFLLAILYAGYLVLFNSMPAGSARIKACAVLGIMICADVPIIYQSVTWWRTLHQPPTLMRSGGSVMDADMRLTLLWGLLATVSLGVWLLRQRGTNLLIQAEIEAASFEQMNASTHLGVRHGR